jgi:hypothetical protein
VNLTGEARPKTGTGTSTTVPFVKTNKYIRHFFFIQSRSHSIISQTMLYDSHSQHEYINNTFPLFDESCFLNQDESA